MEPLTPAEFLSQTEVPENIGSLVNRELSTPVIVEEDRSIRVKVTDSCGMACEFCHNEGTPVTNPHQRDFNGRVSIYEDTNGVGFVADRMSPGSEFASCIGALKNALDIDELHWSGGEPTLNRDIAELSRQVSSLGIKVKMTSNGETGNMRIPDLSAAGLSSINFSIFGTTPEEIAQIQSPRFQNLKYGAAKLRKLVESINCALEYGIDAKANIVVQGPQDYPRIERIINKFGNSVKVRLLPSLDEGMPSVMAIYQFLADIGAEPTRRIINAGTSNIRTDFILPDGVNIGFKQINRVVLPETCSECLWNNSEDCKEGYYGVRLYQDTEGAFQVGVCIQSMDLSMPLDEFLVSPRVDEIKEFRQNEFAKLTQRYRDFLSNVVE